MKTLRKSAPRLGGVPDGFNLNPKLVALAGAISLPKTKRISYAVRSRWR